MISVSQYTSNRQMPAETSVVPVCPTYKSETGIDVALLVSALFLQRFSFSFRGTFLMLDFVPVAFILLYLFLSGKLLIQYDRLLWFLGIALAATCSLLLNFKSTMLTSYSLFLVLYSLVTLSRPSTPDRYKSTLYAFQFLVMLLSCLAVAQFVAQFVVDGRKLIMFYGMIPDFLLGVFNAGGANTIHPIEGSSLLKSNGIFLAEPSNLSQITALGILIEVLEFRRPRYLLAMVLGFLMAYSGVGVMVLLLFLPLAGLRHGRAGLSALFVAMFALGLFATGIIDLSVFLFRADEFQDTHASGFARFVSPLWLTAKHFDTASLQALLVGSGPGTAKTLVDVDGWYAANPSSWLKLLYEYGVIGSFIFVSFCASCLRRSRCSGLVLAALIFIDVFAAGFLTTWFLTIMIVLCTLHAPEPRRSRVNRQASSLAHPRPLQAG
jgi:hypothetical protein